MADLFDEFAKDAELIISQERGDELPNPGAVYTKAEVDKLLEEQAKSILQQLKKIAPDEKDPEAKAEPEKEEPAESENENGKEE